MLYQRTVRSTVRGEGVGLHSGELATFRILPAAPDTGLVFVRSDLHPPVEIPATTDHVVHTVLATSLGKDGVSVQTVEHLIAALSGLGIDNARVEVDGPEIPILDGSAARFVDLIREAGGTVAQRKPKRFLVVTKTVMVGDGDKFARLEPAACFSLRATIDFDHPIVNRQTYELAMSDTAFLRELAPARTFGFAKDVEKMHAAGLARGGSLDNAVVVDDYSVQNPEGLRFPDEFVRHTMLDAVGDLALLGLPIIGRYVAYKGGHALNTQLVAALREQPRAYEIHEFRARREVARAQLELPVFRLGRLAPI
ncbi:MAG: UDP-3-O-acyl-N-acetylglucosamine deacetylase [Deltaproteobacteria bacterium]